MPDPVAPERRTSGVAALVLAAGSSQRMGKSNKLLLPLVDRPVLLHVIEATLQSRLREVTVVTGHERPAIEAALAGMPVRCVHNPQYRNGLAASLRCGLDSLSGQVSGVMVLLGDMPLIRCTHIERLLSAFESEAERDIIVPLRGDQRGNPLLWAWSYVGELRALSGDSGGRQLLERHAGRVRWLEVEDDAFFRDIDDSRSLGDVRRLCGP